MGCIMPSKNRGLLCTQIKARTEVSKAKFPETVIPERNNYMAVYVNNKELKKEKKSHTRQR